MTILIFAAGLLLGSVFGLLVGGLAASSKIQSAYSEGYDRGKIVSTNSIS
jgi:hypothetical protein